MAAILILEALETLIPEIRRMYGQIPGVKEELDKLKETLSLIQDVLEDAEQKQVQDKAVQNWLGRLRDVAYDAEDILVEEWATKARKQDDESQSQITQLCKCLPHFKLKFCHNMAKKIKKIRESFDEVQKQSSVFRLATRVANTRREVGESSRPPTRSLVNESSIWGRCEDKQKVIQLLLNDTNNEKDVFVLPIVGMGGLGKTTLAQLVYYDLQVVSHFDLRMWICVSENFELVRLTRDILASARQTNIDLLTLDPIHESLQKELNGKKFLLVLDDVWNEDQEKWRRLEGILNCSKESAIIVTTRNENVAAMMGSRSQYYKLEGLSYADGWEVLYVRAFGGRSNDVSPDLVAISRLITKKCGGLPLALIAFGNLLFSQSDEEWIKIWHIIETEKLPNPETTKIRLSYHQLPFELKRCFAYFSIFPKDHMIEKENLIYLWIANDFILPKPRMELEDIGNQIFNELVRHSLLQVVRRDRVGNIITCQMHDLLHDLGRDVIGNELSTFANGKVGVVPKETRHLICDGKISPESLCDAWKVRTLFLQSNEAGESLKFNISNLRWVRLLDLSGCHISELSESIGNLLRLKYLDLSNNDFTTLPAISNLQNLQTLILKYCRHLTELPKDTRKISGLRHLDVSGCDKLIAMPNQIGQLTSLQNLPTFVVGEGSECGISQLGDLNLIRGELWIMRLERVRNGMNPQEAKLLLNKNNLRALKLSWDEGLDDEEAIKSSEETLNNLQPCENLEQLMIFRYPGHQFSRWLQASLDIPYLVVVDLRRCYNCESLPPLGQLPCLKHLHIEAMDAVKYIGVDFYGEDKSKSFPSLEKFKVKGMDNLEEWSFVEDKREVFPCLKKLTITNLKKLSYFPEGLLRNCTMLKTLKLENCQMLRTLGRELESLDSTESLRIDSCVELECLSEEGIRGLTYLRELKITGCSKLTTISPVLEGLPSLKTLEIYRCGELISLPEGIGKLIHLESLTISLCESLASFPQEGIGWLTSLQILALKGLPSLTSLPKGIGRLASLKDLTLHNLPNLRSLQEGIGGLTSLQVLTLEGLPKLTCLPEGLGGLSSLKDLTLNNLPNLTCLPEGEGGLDSLEDLILSGFDSLHFVPEGGFASLG